MMTANTRGSFLMEPVDRKTVLPAKVATSIERKKTEAMPGSLVEDRAGAAVDPNRNNNRGNE